MHLRASRRRVAQEGAVRVAQKGHGFAQEVHAGMQVRGLQVRSLHVWQARCCRGIPQESGEKDSQEDGGQENGYQEGIEEGGQEDVEEGGQEAVQESSKEAQDGQKVVQEGGEKVHQEVNKATPSERKTFCASSIDRSTEDDRVNSENGGPKEKRTC